MIQLANKKRSLLLAQANPTEVLQRSQSFSYGPGFIQPTESHLQMDKRKTTKKKSSVLQRRLVCHIQVETFSEHGRNHILEILSPVHQQQMSKPTCLVEFEIKLSQKSFSNLVHPKLSRQAYLH